MTVGQLMDRSPQIRSQMYHELELADHGQRGRRTKKAPCLPQYLEQEAEKGTLSLSRERVRNQHVCAQLGDELDRLVNKSLLILRISVIPFTKWLTDISHGKGRAAGNTTTFHIDIQLTLAGDHKSRIKFGYEVLASSEVNWKANRPLLQVLGMGA